MEHFQYQTLTDILKMEGDRMKEVVEKYREVKVQTSREKTINTQYNDAQGVDDECNTMFMGTDSISWRRYQEVRNRRDSNTRREDSRG